MWRQGHCLHRRHISSSSTKVATARCICKNIQTTFTSKHRQQHRHGQLPPKYENRQQVWKSLSKQYFSTTTPSSSPSSSSSSSSSKDDRQGVGLTNADFDDDDFQQQQQQQHQLQNDKVGLIYHPHKYKLLESQQWLAEHIRCCITGKFLHILQDNATTDIEEDHDDNYNNNNNQNNGTSIDSNVIGNGKNVAIQRGNNNIITNGNNNNLNSSTDMSLYFLGTSAGMPTRSRSTTSTLLRLGGYAYLFDVGEGTQRQLMFAMGKLSEIERIFITHLHGDHVMGLPALLLGMQNAFKDSKTKTNENRKKERMRNKNNQQHRRTSRSEDQSSSSGSSKDFTVKIYGPPGLYNYVVSSLCYTCSQIHFINIEVYELVGGRVRRQHFSHHRGQDNDDNNNNSNNNSRTKNPFDGSYPEFNHPRITRHKIRCDEKDRIWYIEDLEPVTEQSILGGRSDRRSIRRATQIQAAEVDHMNGVATFGYTVTEEEPPNNIDIEKAKALGILPGKGGKKLSLLQRGFPVEPDNQEQDMVDTNKSSSTTTTNTLIRPEQVWSLPKKKKARKVAIVGDNRGWTTQMTQIAQNTDVLVHEATLSEEDFSRGHSTASMAGRESGKVNAGVLILHHISPRFDGIDMTTGLSNHTKLINDATYASKNRSTTFVAYDFMELVVPWKGFVEEKEKIEKEEATEKPIPSTTMSAGTTNIDDHGSVATSQHRDDVNSSITGDPQEKEDEKESAQQQYSDTKNDNENNHQERKQGSTATSLVDTSAAVQRWFSNKNIR